MAHHPLQHREAWLLRLVLLGVLAFQAVTGNLHGALVAGEGILLSFAPQVIERFGKTHVPRALECVYVLAIALQFVSESTKLFEVFYYWDKLVHPVEIALSAVVSAWLLLGYRDAGDERIPDHLVAALSMLVGATIGAVWEFFEFWADWFGDANLQKSNGDTITDLISNNLGSVIATLVAMWVYKQRVGRNQRLEMGAIAIWLTGGIAALLDRRGRLVGSIVALLLAGVLGAIVWVDRGTPALADGLAPGEARHWAFTQAADDWQPLTGDWTPDERGICRTNPDLPKPGSEKMGLIALAPGTVYGRDGQAFSLNGRYFVERPPRPSGSQMNAGLAFGVRDAANFYILEASALHDFVRVDRYVNGRRRDIRETLYRTHGNEWHTLELQVRGDEVTAGIDGTVLYRTRVADVAGGVGLWARATTAACFSEAVVQLGP